MGEIIDAAGVETEAHSEPTVIDAEGVDYIDAGAVDAGPAARRAASGMAPGPKSYSDEQLGLDAGPVATTYVSPTVRKLFPTVAASMEKMPANAAEAAEKARIAKLVGAQQSIDTLGRTVGTMALTGPAVAAGKAGAAFLGAGPRLATLVGGASAGAGAGAVADRSVKGAVTGAAVGGALPALVGASDLMRFVARRGIAKGFARAKGGEEGAALLGKEYENVINKYEIAGVKNPVVAKESIQASIAKAEAAKKLAQESIASAGGLAGKGQGKWQPSEDDIKFAEKLKMPLEQYRDIMAKRTLAQHKVIESPHAVKAAEDTLKQAEHELEILRTLQPIANKVAAAHALKPTMLERVGTGAKKVAKFAVPAAAGGAAYKMLTGGK